MKYVVTVGGQAIEVEVDGDRVTMDGKAGRATLAPIPETPLFQLLVDGRPVTFAVEALGPGRWGISRAGERWEVEVLDERARHLRNLTAGGDRRRQPDVLKAPMPGLVVRVQARPGDRVEAGSGLVVLEAMKMENELKAAAPGVVKTVMVEPGAAVEKGQILVEFEA